MAACSIFEEDEVYVVNEKGFKCGLVLESSEYVSSDDEDDSDFDYERVRSGTIRVAWHPEGEEEVIAEKNVKLADRSLMPGDVVRRMICGQDSQRGYVRNTSVSCHVQLLGKNKIITNISSEDLEPLQKWSTEPGDVTLDGWVGKIEHINEEVTLRFPDGACCVVCDDEFINELFRFEDVSESRNRESEFCVNDYYPGQQFRGDLGDLVSANWTHPTCTYSKSVARSSPYKEITVTVKKVETKSIDVHWVCRGYAKLEDNVNDVGAPPSRLDKEQIKRLKKLDCFEACSIQIGDKAFFVIKDNDNVLSIPAKVKHVPLLHIMDNSGKLKDPKVLSEPIEDVASETVANHVPAVNEDAATNGCLEETVTEPANNAADQDAANDGDDDSDFEDEEGCLSDAGSTASTHSTASNSSTSSRKKKCKKGPVLQTRLMKKKKLKRARRKHEERLPVGRPGDKVAVEIIYTFSNIEVMWQDGTIEKDIPSTELFPIHHLDELEFFPGDFVIRSSENEAVLADDSYGVVEKVDHAGRTCHVRWMKPYQVGKGDRPDVSICSEEVSVYDIKDHPDYKFRPGHVVVRVGGYFEDQLSHSEAAGQIYELRQDGSLLVQWSNNTTSICYCQDLYLIGDELSELGSEAESSSDDSDSDGDDASSEASWETEEEEEEVGAEAEEKQEGNTGSTSSVLQVEPDKKIELDQLLDTARSTLQKLEDTFAQNVDIAPCAEHCYREILRIHRNCRDLNKMLSAAYFDDQCLVSTIRVIRKELKHEKAARIARQVLELFEANSRHSNTKLEKYLDGESLDKTDKKKIGKNRVISERGSEDCASGVLVAAGADSHLQENVASLTGSGDGSEAAGLTGQNKPPEGACNGVVEASELSKCCAAGETCGAEGVVNCTESKEAAASSEVATQTGIVCATANNTKAKDLCQTACRLLKEQIMKVHEDLEMKWQELKDAGRLKVLGEDEEDDEDEFPLPPEIAAAVIAATAAAEAADSQASKLNTLPPNPSDSAKTSPTPKITEPTPPISPANGTSEKEATPRQGLGLDLNITSPTDVDEMKRKIWEPPTPQTPAEIRAKLLYNVDGFSLVDRVPDGHRFKPSEHQPSDPKSFFTAIKRELKLLRSSLPIGIYVKGYEDRMDLYTVMILGPVNTPYEDGLFFFDVQLPSDYPTSPPSVHYISYCTDRLNPNLYEEGKVCVSLLGTWAGKGTEIWHSKSNLLQVLVSIQGLILVSEPYYNEAGYEKQKGSQEGHENSRMYNEMAICKMVQSMTRIAMSAPVVYECEVVEHMREHAFRMVHKLQHWIELSKNPDMTGSELVSEDSACNSRVPNGPLIGPDEEDDDSSSASQDNFPGSPARLRGKTLDLSPPEFPLLPGSKGFQLTLAKNLEQFKVALASIGVTDPLLAV